MSDEYREAFKKLYGREPEQGEMQRIGQERRRNTMDPEELQKAIFEQVRKETKEKYEKEKKQRKTVDELFDRNR